MLDFECVNCGKKISRDLDTFVGFVRCPVCNKRTAVFVKDKKLITTDYDMAQIREILSKKEVR